MLYERLHSIVHVRYSIIIKCICLMLALSINNVHCVSSVIAMSICMHLTATIRHYACKHDTEHMGKCLQSRCK